MADIRRARVDPDFGRYALDLAQSTAGNTHTRSRESIPTEVVIQQLRNIAQAIQAGINEISMQTSAGHDLSYGKKTAESRP